MHNVYNLVILQRNMCSICFQFTINLGVESHMECIKLLLQLSDFITFVHQ